MYQEAAGEVGVGGEVLGDLTQQPHRGEQHDEIYSMLGLALTDGPIRARAPGLLRSI